MNEKKKGRFTNLSAKAELTAILIGIAITIVGGIIVTYNHFAKSTELEAAKTEFRTASDVQGEEHDAFKLETQKEFVEVEIKRERREVDRYQEKARDAERLLSRYERRRVQTLEENIKGHEDRKRGLEQRIVLERQIKLRKRRRK